MGPEWLPSLAKAASEQGILAQVYGDLAKPGVAQVGRALSTVLGLGNTILWPIQLFNERARLALEANLERYREKVANIPNEKVVPVAPELGVPLAEKLSHVSDTNLRELYTNLLARASNSDTQSQAHPSFVNVLNNMCPDEAALLRQFQSQDGAVPFVSVRFVNPQTALWMEIRDVSIELLPATALAFPQNLPAYISNLEGLGLIAVRHDRYTAPVSKYESLEKAMQEQFGKIQFPEGHTQLQCPRGKIEITHFGWLFISACVT